MNSENPVKSVGVLTTDVIFTIRIAEVPIGMPGDVGGLLSDEESYPDMHLLPCTHGLTNISTHFPTMIP
jgi:hypothetical protein